MTIKQLGGVFGRNPTFNDVTIEGQLTFDGDIDVNSDLKVDGDLEVTGTSFLDGHVGIGVDPAVTGLHLQGTDNVSSSFTITNTANSNTWKFQPQYNALQLRIFGQGSEVAQFDASNNFNLIGGGNLVVNSGNGIDFSATAGTGTSELLADYEEGVWTVNYAPTTGAFTTITTVGLGRYTKVGRLVTVFGSVRTSGTLDVTGASGNLKITGLPFACNATVSGGGADLSHQSWNLGTDILNTRMSVAAGASEILMFKNTMNGSSFPSGNITVADMSTSGGSFANLISFTASYEV